MLTLTFGVIAALMLACTSNSNDSGKTGLTDRQGAATGNIVPETTTSVPRKAIARGVGLHDWPQWRGNLHEQYPGRKGYSHGLGGW